VASVLMLGGCEVGIGFGLRASLGVFDARMIRVYRSLGWRPEILGSQGEGADRISLGLWRFSEDLRQQLADRASVSPNLSRLWFDRAFGAMSQQRKVG
jgi:acyl homoserine lactone synthase